MKNTAIAYDVTQCSLAEIHRRKADFFSLPTVYSSGSLFNSKDRGSIFLRNVGGILRHHLGEIPVLNVNIPLGLLYKSNLSSNYSELVTTWKVLVQTPQISPDLSLGRANLAVISKIDGLKTAQHDPRLRFKHC
jgi:hypothetical protein